MRHATLRFSLTACLAAASVSMLSGQIVWRPPAQQPPAPAPAPPAQPAAQPAAPAAQAPATPNAAAPVPNQAGQAPAPAPVEPARLTDSGGFLLDNVSLVEMIDILAKRMKINYILDPAVKGAVTIHTYGEIRPVDLMPLMETILRVNGATMVKVGDLYRIVPVKSVSQLPLSPVVDPDGKTLPEDERMVLSLIFLKYVTSADIVKLIQPFLGEGATISTYDPANLLLIEDNSRNQKRTMELLALFDSDTFAGQRVQLFEVTNSRPTAIAKELDSVFKAYALSEKASAVKFLAVDRINTIIAVAPNPGVFAQVKSWIAKLDIPVKVTAGDITNYVYRLKYGRAETVAMAITALYTGDTMALAMLGAMAQSGGMYGGMGYGGYGGMGGGMGYGGMGYGGMGYGGMGYGGMGYGGMGYGGMGYGGMGYGGGYGGGYGLARMGGINTPPVSTPNGPNANPTPNSGPNDLTGSYLGTARAEAQSGIRMPHVIPNPFDNTLLIQGTPQEYEQITNLLRQLDVPPRQVLIDAKIMEVQLSGALSAGVTSYLEKKDTGPFSRTLNAVTSSAGLGLSTGALVLRSHELLAALQTSELRSKTRVMSAPSIIATDSIPAVMNVGSDVPVLTSQGVVGGVQDAGSNIFASNISNRSTGVTLSIVARVNSSGVVTLVVDQDVSAPQANTTSGISSPQFSRRSFQTQLTVQDGDTVAIGGFISEEEDSASKGVPFLNRIPLVGFAFGSKSYSKARTELIVFLTPRVIYDTNQVLDATDEIKSGLKNLRKLMQDQ